MTLTIGSIFAGIGGIEYGLGMTGLGPVVWQIEKDPFCRQVLAKHWPMATRYKDVCSVEPNTIERVGIICMGLPCQPFSVAGRKTGMEDDRWLWPQAKRIVCAVQPRYVVIENVPSFLTTRNGEAIRTVLGDMAQLGFDAWYGVLSAQAIGAPHLRKRLFILGWRRELGNALRIGQTGHERRTNKNLFENADQSTVANDNSVRESQQASAGHGLWNRSIHCGQGILGGSIESSMGRDVDGLSGGMDRHLWPAPRGKEQYDYEPQRTTKEKAKDRSKRIGALGNAVVPQVAQVIGLLIQQIESLNHPSFHTHD